jgi:UDP-N-acetylglucosamine 2-epimerase (non-hydrolysing)
MAPVIMRLKETPGIESRLCVTAQHREMLDQVLSLFQLEPDIDLNLMTVNQTLPQLTASLLETMSEVLKKESPDWVLVQGDTTTVMATALSAFYANVRVGHVEAGLRSHDRYAPYPEEINRRIATLLSDLHFAPTSLARENLLKEGVSEKNCIVTGNPVIDALQWIAKQPFEVKGSVLEGIPFETKRIVLVTAHRRENYGKPLEDICDALLEISELFGDSVQIVYPVHLNPQVRNTVMKKLTRRPAISLLDPLDYRSLIYLLGKATLVLTDSGGLQEEAPGLGVPVLVLRTVTERPEGIASGNLKIVGAVKEDIVRETRRLLLDESARLKMSNAANPYGDGHAAERIVDALLKSNS